MSDVVVLDAGNLSEGGGDEDNLGAVDDLDGGATDGVEETDADADADADGDDQEADFEDDDGVSTGGLLLPSYVDELDGQSYLRPRGSAAIQRARNGRTDRRLRRGLAGEIAQFDGLPSGSGGFGHMHVRISEDGDVRARMEEIIGSLPSSGRITLGGRRGGMPQRLSNVYDFHNFVSSVLPESSHGRGLSGHVVDSAMLPSNSDAGGVTVHPLLAVSNVNPRSSQHRSSSTTGGSLMLDAIMNAVGVRVVNGRRYALARRSAVPAASDRRWGTDIGEVEGSHNQRVSSMISAVESTLPSFVEVVDETPLNSRSTGDRPRRVAAENTAEFENTTDEIELPRLSEISSPMGALRAVRRSVPSSVTNNELTASTAEQAENNDGSSLALHGNSRTSTDRLSNRRNFLATMRSVLSEVAGAVDGHWRHGMGLYEDEDFMPMPRDAATNNATQANDGNSFDDTFDTIMLISSRSINSNHERIFSDDDTLFNPGIAAQSERRVLSSPSDAAMEHTESSLAAEESSLPAVTNSTADLAAGTATVSAAAVSSSDVTIDRPLVCPATVDPEIWMELPEEVQRELMEQEMEEESDAALLAQTSLDRTALAALPSSVRNQVLRDEAT